MDNGKVSCRKFDNAMDRFNDQLVRMSCDMSIMDRFLNSSEQGIWQQAKYGNALQHIAQLVTAASFTIEKARERLISIKRESEIFASEDDTFEGIGSSSTFLDSRLAEVAMIRSAKGNPRPERWHIDN